MTIGGQKYSTGKDAGRWQGKQHNQSPLSKKERENQQSKKSSINDGFWNAVKHNQTRTETDLVEKSWKGEKNGTFSEDNSQNNPRKYETLSSRSEQLNEQIIATRAEIIATRAEIIALKAEVAGLNVDLKKADAEGNEKNVDFLQSQISNREGQITELTKEKAALATQISKNEDLITELTKGKAALATRKFHHISFTLLLH